MQYLKSITHRTNEINFWKQLFSKNYYVLRIDRFPTEDGRYVFSKKNPSIQN